MHILLVDGNPYDAELTKRVLRQYLANPISVARDGAEALESVFGASPGDVGAAGSVPQLILMDTLLTKVDGAELFRRLRADTRTRHVPIIAMAAVDPQLAGPYGSGLAGCPCIVKPLDLPQLAEALRRIEAHWVLVDSDSNPPVS